MTQKAIKVGDSVAVIIPKKSLKGLGIRAGDNINVEVNEKMKEMKISPITKISEDKERIAELTYNFINRYRKDLKSLADK